MPWTLTEKHGKEALKRTLLAGRVAVVGGSLTATWAVWTVWTSLRAGERTVAVAKNSYLMCAAITLAAFIFTVWRWRDLPPHPPETRRLHIWGASAALIWTAMFAAALLALPAA